MSNVGNADNPERTTATGLARFAQDFLEASRSAADGMGRGNKHFSVTPVPVIYLVGHSIELSLKSFLLNLGVSLRDLRLEYKHDLGKLLVAARELGLEQHVQFEEVELGAFEVLNDLYSTKQLEYIVTGYRVFPQLDPIEAFAKKLCEAISPLVGLTRS